ncbi:MAG TPA: hypothetical protein VLV78_12940 [Thermoanaerobaculia bacterium]|nr:hypothetical protein [Thermoanaerobaculia bacterium]
MRSLSRAGLAILMAFAFLALAAAPLCAALLTCSMPCCHHTQQAGIKGVPVCPLSNSCNTSVSSDDEQAPTTVAKSQRVNTRSDGTAAVRVAIDARHPERRSTERQSSDPASVPPLHLLNSVFRI